MPIQKGVANFKITYSHSCRYDVTACSTSVAEHTLVTFHAKLLRFLTKRVSRDTDFNFAITKCSLLSRITLLR